MLRRTCQDNGVKHGDSGAGPAGTSYIGEPLFSPTLIPLPVRRGSLRHWEIADSENQNWVDRLSTTKRDGGGIHLSEVLDGDWVRRAWTFQELILATNPVILCGDRVLL